MSSVLPVRKSSSNASKPSDTTLQLIQGGPELILREVNLSTNSLNHGNLDKSQFSDRFHSFGSFRQASGEAGRHDDSTLTRRPMMDYCIPLSDVVVADVLDARLLFVTTHNHGYFEFSFWSKNALDLMVAFLSASLAKERVVITVTEEQDSVWQDPLCSFDVETLTANRMKERVQQETLSEKFRRKVAHVAFQIGECKYCSSDYWNALHYCCLHVSIVSTAFSECTCGDLCSTTTTAPEEQERRESPPRKFVPGDLEIAAHSADELASLKLKKSNSTMMEELEPELKSANS